MSLTVNRRRIGCWFRHVIFSVLCAELATAIIRAFFWHELASPVVIGLAIGLVNGTSSFVKDQNKDRTLRLPPSPRPLQIILKGRQPEWSDVVKWTVVVAVGYFNISATVTFAILIVFRSNPAIAFCLGASIQVLGTGLAFVSFYWEFRNFDGTASGTLQAAPLATGNSEAAR